MPEKKTTVSLPNISPIPLDGYEVPVLESTERWTELKLEDNSVLRLKPNVLKVTRIEGKWDNEGNPLYAINSMMTMVVASAPDRLRKQNDASPKVN
jgi:hypothetical protein